MKKFQGTIIMWRYTLIPILLYVSKSKITSGISDTFIYSIHVTPLVQLSFNVRK